MADVAPLAPVNEEDLKDLKERMKLIADADPNQYHNEFSLKRYLRAFKSVDAAFQVIRWNFLTLPQQKNEYLNNFQALLKTNKWRCEYNVAELTLDHPDVKKHYEGNKARVLRHRDMAGRPVIYIPAKNHNVNERNIDELTKFIVYCLVSFKLTTRIKSVNLNFFILDFS